MTRVELRLLSLLVGAMLADAALAASPAAKPHPAPPAASKAAQKPAVAGNLASLGGAASSKGTAAIAGSPRGR